MAKSKIDMITSGMTYLVTDIFPAIVIDSTFLLLVGRCLLLLATQNRYPPKCGYKNVWKYVFFARHRASLLTIPFLDFIEFSEFSKSHLGKIQMAT